MSKFVFRPVSTIINALNEPGLMAQRLALFAEGPVVIAVIDYTANARSQSAVVTNFHDTASAFLPTEWQIGTSVVGYVPAIFEIETEAHNYAWNLFLNMTHTHFDLVVRRHVRRATATAVQKKRLFSDLGESYFEHGVHPSTLDDEAWVEAMIRRLDDHLFQARFYADQAKTQCLLPDNVVAELRALTQGLLDQRPDNFDDNDEPIPHDTHYVPNYVNADGSFPDWDDAEHGLEVRMSRQYEQQHGAYA